MSDQPVINQIASDNSRLELTAGFPKLTSEALFANFTQPELLQRWWPAQATIEPHLGGAYHLSWPDMDWYLRGEITVFETARRLGFTWRWDHEPGLPTRQVDLVFDPAGSGSRLTITHGPYDKSQRDQDDRQSHLEGWTHFLGQLSALD